MFLRTTAQFAAALVLAASPSFAENWEAIVVGQSGSSAPRAFGDAFYTAESLRSGGFDTVQMLRDVPQDTLLGAIAALTGTERALLYFSGPVDGNRLVLQDGSLPISAIVDGLAGAGINQAAILIEDCANPAGVSRFAMPEVPANINVYFGASVGPGGICTDLPERMTEKLQAAVDVSLQDGLDGLWFETTLTEPIMLTRRPETTISTVAESAPIISVVSNDVIAIAPVTSSIEAAPTLVSISPSTAAAPQPRQTGSDSVVTFAAPEQSQLAAIPAVAGLPEPSIVVGLLENVNFEFDDVAPQGEVTSTEVSYDNLEARRSLRDGSPDLFETLVSSGAFDPPENLLADALQTELARMGCYTAAIDGLWGGGSRRSVERYFDEIAGVNAVSLEPDIPLFRQIIRQDDIVCRVPVAAAPRPAATNTPRTNNTAARTRQPAAPARQQAAPRRQQQAPAASSGRTIQRNRLGGVFR